MHLTLIPSFWHFASAALNCDKFLISMSFILSQRDWIVHEQKKVITPDELLARGLDYFDWCEENPIYTISFVGKDAIECKTPNHRTPTLIGLLNYIGYPGLKRIDAFLRDKPQYEPVLDRLKAMVTQAQLENGMAGVANPGLVARILGLQDRKEVETKVQGTVVIRRPDNGRLAMPTTDYEEDL